MKENQLSHLLRKFAAGELTGEEQQQLEKLLSDPNRDELAEQVATLMENTHPAPVTAEPSTADTFSYIIAADKTVPAEPNRARRISLRWLVAAAVLLVSFSAVLYFMTGEKEPSLANVTKPIPVKPEKDPGRNTAILTLADNSEVALDSVGNGLVATQAGTKVLLKDGQLSYKHSADAPQTVAYNKITTPRGGEYQITLSDGTKVWLNAASSLTFPTVFTGPNREVVLTGEAFLEVAKDVQHPFVIKVKDMNVSVLGTELNIMSYDDEPETVTTLVSGSVRVSSPGNADQVLTPGQHAVINNQTGNVVVKNADIEEETAWKNGRIHFTAANIRKIMRQVSRWYDVDIRFEGNVQNLDFTCTVSRKDKLSKLLQLLELTRAVHFTMEDNTVIVQP